MLTNKITGFSADLLNTVRGILGEAKKCPADCECEKCEAEEDDEDEDEKEMKEGSMPTADEPTDANKKTADKVRALLAKEKKPVKEEIDADLEAELKATRQTTKSIRGHSRGAMGRAVMKKERNLAQARMDRAAEMKKEEAEHTNCGTPECCGQCDTAEQIDEATAKIVAHLQKRYGDNIRKSHVRSAASDFGVDASKLAKAVRTKLGKTSLAEDEQIDEVSKATLGRYINKAKDSIDLTAWRQGYKEAGAGNPSKPLEKKLTKRHKGISTAVSKLTKEDAEQIDELSKGTMGRYINKAATKMGSQGVTAGLKIAADEKSSKNFKDMGKREKGIKLAVSKLTKEDAEQVDEGSYKDNPRHMGTIGPITTDAERRERAKKYREKLTKEEQDFIDSLNDADMEQIDELSKETHGSYVKKAASDLHKVGADRAMFTRSGSVDKLARKAQNRKKGIDTAVSRMTKEDTEITEARGRPKKAGAKDFTIHPKTKEKLMHNNPEHMAKIERLQKNKVLDKPKVEAGQHIMNQLSKAKTSMLGGSTIHFTHGDSKHVSGTHAAKLLTKYAGMKPSEKEDFQKKIGHSHEQLMKHV